MTKSILLISSLLWLQAPLALAAEMQIDLDTLAVEDGDTVLIPFNGKEIRLQLLDIDAPEDSNNPKLLLDLQTTGLDRNSLLALGQASTARLKQLIASLGPFQARFDPDLRDRYGRINGEVFDAQGRSLAATLVAEGYAVPTKPADTPSPHRASTLQAKAENRGLWADATAKAMAAWSKY
ncbi:MAG: thermonuclease family protein [Gammaproteobacteria bacterium SHHR-1]